MMSNKTYDILCMVEANYPERLEKAKAALYG